MGAYKHDVVVVIKMGAYIHGCLFCVGAYYPDFMMTFTLVTENTWKCYQAPFPIYQTRPGNEARCGECDVECGGVSVGLWWGVG